MFETRFKTRASIAKYIENTRLVKSSLIWTFSNEEKSDFISSVETIEMF